MADDKPDVVDAAHQVIVLAFDLADTEAAQLPNQIVEALKSPPVQNAITKTLLDFAKTKAQSGASVVSDDEARKLLTSLGTGIKDAASNELIEQIKKTPQYKKLMASVEGFKKAAESSTLGVWIDKNKKILYVVGAALVVGSASVLYITKTGGTVVNLAVDPLKGKEFEVLQVGTLKIKVGLLDFQPDARVLGARVIGTKTWDKIALELKLGFLAQGAEVQKAEGEAVMKSGPFSVTLAGAAKPQVHEVNLGLRLGYDGIIGNGKFNVGIGAMYQDKAVSGTLGASFKTKSATFGLQGNLGPQQGGGVQYGALATLDIAL